jgi:hypothetical protein
LVGWIVGLLASAENQMYVCSATLLLNCAAQAGRATRPLDITLKVKTFWTPNAFEFQHGDLAVSRQV